MKIAFFILLSSIVTSAFSEDELSKAFNKRKGSDCVLQLSDIRKKARALVDLTNNIAKVEVGTVKEDSFAQLYLKLKNEDICSEQPAKTKLGTIYVQYTCRDKSGKATLERSVDVGHTDCTREPIK